MHCTFPYFEDRPHIPLVVEYKGKPIRFLPLLDSGADFSIFYRVHANELGINWTEGEDIHLVNADGSSFHAKQFRMKIFIEGFPVFARLCFVDKVFNCTPVLGRRDIFHNFIITIDERAKNVELRSH
jgi:hypothetical protein